MSKKIIFLLLGEKAYHVFSHIVDEYCTLIAGVILGRDINLSDDYAEKIVEICRNNNIPFIERRAGNSCFNSRDKYFISIGWRWLVPVRSDRLIVLHDSLLPRYRGFAPLVSSLINGENVVGATALFGAKNYDCGNVIVQKSIDVCYPIKISKIIKEISNIYLEIVLELIKKINSNEELIGTPQNESEATYSLWRDKNDYLIDWSRDAKEISRFVDAVGYPYDGAKSFVNKELVTIHDVLPVEDVTVSDRKNAIGKVVFVENDFPIVVCGQGLLKIVSMVPVDGPLLLPLMKFRSRFTSRP